MPDNDKMVNILYDNNEVSSGESNKGFWYDCMIEEHVHQSKLTCKVIAWQPLPEPPIE